MSETYNTEHLQLRKFEMKIFLLNKLAGFEPVTTRLCSLLIQPRELSQLAYCFCGSSCIRVLIGSYLVTTFILLWFRSELHISSR